MIEFCAYVKRFSNVQNDKGRCVDDGICQESLQLRVHLFYFLHHLFLYIDKEERKRVIKIYKEEQTKFMDQIESSTDPSLELYISAPKNQSKTITVSSLV